MNGSYHTPATVAACVWLSRGVLACRLGLYDEACDALDKCNTYSFSLHGWMAKLQVLVMMTQLGDDMLDTDQEGSFRGKNRTFKLMESAMEALCRVMLFVQEFNNKYETVSEAVTGQRSASHSGTSIFSLFQNFSPFTILIYSIFFRCACGSIRFLFEENFLHISQSIWIGHGETWS